MPARPGDSTAGNRFRSSFDQIAVGVAHTATDGKILEVNRKLCEMLGYSAAELLGMTTRDLTHPDDRDRQDHMRREVLDGTRHHFSGDKRYVRKDGSDFWVTRTVALARDTPDGEPYLIQTIDDISERKRAEATLLRLSRARRVMADCTHILVHTVDETAMLNSICRIVVESGGYKQAWIGLKTGDPVRPVRPVAHAGYGDDSPMTAPGTWALSGHYQGVAATALISGETHIVRDILHDPQHEKVRSRAVQLGYQSSIALPLAGGGQTVGVLVLHADERDAFDEEEIRLLNELSGDIGFGIASLHARAAQEQAEQRSRENEKRFREIFEQAAVGITRVDLNGVLIDCNQKFSDMLGHTREELLGRTVKEITHPDDYGLGAQYRAQIANNVTKSRASEKRFLRKDGAPVWTRRTMSTACDAAGKPQYIISVIEDITARKEADTRYRATFDNAPIGIMHTAIDSYKILHANPKLCEMLGYTQDELLNMTSTDVVHPDDRFTDGAKYKDPIMKGDALSFSSERRLIRKDGSLLWVNRTVSLARDVSGNPLYYIRIIEDITERKQAREAMVRERVLLRTIIDAIPDHIYAKDKAGLFMLANKGWLEARSVINTNIAGKTTHDFFRPRLAEMLAAQDREIVQTGNPIPTFEHKMPVKRRDGKPAMVGWGSTIKVPMRTAAGEIIGTVGISRDITDEKAAETRQAMEHTVTRVLAEAVTVSEAMPKIMQTMCQAMGWAYGARWALDKDGGGLSRVDYWSAVEPAFDPADREMWLKVPSSGSGRLLRRAWVDQVATWLTNLHDGAPFRRKPSLLKLGWQSAYAFPILANGQTIGVIEFFGPDIREPDQALLQVTQAIGSQIGQFIQRKEAEDKVAFLAQFDIITDLPNRFLFTDRLDQMLAQSERNSWSVGVLFVDLDHFKSVNDTHGHAAGDNLLRQVALRMKECVRKGDTVGRLSGDEFAVMLSNLANSGDAGLVAQKIVESLSAPFDLDGHQTYISASVGIALYPGDGENADTLLKNADAAMYLAKDQGRNGYQFYLPQMKEQQIQRQQLDTQLRGALERKEFLLHYQPKVSLATGAITGFEALLRWQRDGQMIPPSEFIPIMEDTGLIVQAGTWVLDTACKQIKQWEQEGVPVRPVAVNLSARQFQRKNLPEVVRQVLQENQLEPSLLKLELTESLLMSDAKESIETLHQLKALGVQLSVDDFGTGYSSLAYLRRFPLDELKIDREFIRDAVSDPDDAAIALTIINLAHSLKLRVVAEGVETEGQLNFLRSHGCDEVQGFYLARPQPPAECARMLAEDNLLPQPRGIAAGDVTTLLLVVSNEAELKLLTEAYTPAGYRVMTARNANDGFELLARQSMNIVITDNEMPEMSGVEFLTRVRKLHPDTLRVLASSGDDTPTLTRATNKAGIHLFLPYGWAAERLCAEMREALQAQVKATTADDPHPILKTKMD